MIDIWEANARALEIFFLAVIAFVMVWKFLGPKEKVDSKRKKQ